MEVGQSDGYILPVGVDAYVYQIVPALFPVIAGEADDNNTIRVEITQQMSAIAGKGNYEISIISNLENRTLTSFPFFIIISKSSLSIPSFPSFPLKYPDAILFSKSVDTLFARSAALFAIVASALADVAALFAMHALTKMDV